MFFVYKQWKTLKKDLIENSWYATTVTALQKIINALPKINILWSPTMDFVLQLM